MSEFLRRMSEPVSPRVALWCWRLWMAGWALALVLTVILAWRIL